MHAHLIHVVALVAAVGILAQWLAWRFRVPAIVLLTAAGFIVGPATGWVIPSQDFGELLQPIVQLAVAVILFEGGLNLHFHELAEAGKGVRRLVSVGLVVSFVVGSVAAHFIGGLSWPSAIVFGAIIVVTGPTVIMPLLRQARLKARPASLLKWEGIVNDPLGAVLAVVAYEFFVHHNAHGGFGLFLNVALMLTLAGALGWLAGMALGASYRRGWVPEYLKGPAMLATVLGTFALGNLLLEEAGLLTVTVLGMALGNAKLPSIEELRRFKENITVILVSALFIVLTANLDPALLGQIDIRGFALIGFVVLIHRPLVIFLATMGTDLSFQERALIGWIAPRGIVAAAVAGAFSAKMAEAGYADAAQILPLIFVLIIVTVVAHGFSIGWLARRLGLASSRSDGVVIVGASPWAIDLATRFDELDVPVVIAEASWHRLRPARLKGLKCHFGQVISESAEEALDLSATGYVFAATDNDAYNALVCTRFSNEFNRNAVFQLPMPRLDEDEKKGLTPTMRGQRAFSDEALYEEMLKRYFEGWRFQKTRLTETFDFDSYSEKHAATGLYAAIAVKAQGGLAFDLERYSPGDGDVVINFLPPAPVSADEV